MLSVGLHQTGWKRRDVLHVGALSALGVAWPDAAAAASSVPSASPRPARYGRAKRCLLLFLTGGPPQHDTFDMKPHAPDRIRGELRPIATNVPGIEIGELFPNLAQRADRYCIVRSMTHEDRVHTSAGYAMLTGMRHPAANSMNLADSRPNPLDHPHLGAIYSQARPHEHGIPPFIALPEIIKDAAVNEFPGQGAGLLGAAYDPFRIEANAARDGLDRPAVFLPDEITVSRLDDRQRLVSQLDRGLARREATAVTQYDAWSARAWQLLYSSAVRSALDLDRESPEHRARYGSHLFGQGCLLGRRLLEAGVPFVTVYWHYEGPDDSPVWDTHWNNFKHLRERLIPPTDRAISALFDDLTERGMWDDTLVFVTGEFGRTPQINEESGRDHWAQVYSLLLAGAGIPAGTVYGASDRIGGEPADRPVTPADFAATVLHLLGVPPETILRDRLGRPVPACHGEPVAGLLA